MHLNDIECLKFLQDFKYQLTGCTTVNAIFSETLNNVPNNPNKIWTIVKTSEEFIIYCNEVRVMRMVFRDRVDRYYTECYSKWGQVVSHISLISGVTAYRSGGRLLESFLLSSFVTVPMLEIPKYNLRFKHVF